MTNISQVFNDLFRPEYLLVIYKNETAENIRYYVETCPLDADGRPLAPHPLAETEARELASLLQEPNSSRVKSPFLRPEGIFPSNVLYTALQPEPFAVWFTRAAVVPLLFHSSLKINSGSAAIPSLVWKATAKTLSVFASKDDHRPVMSTSLYHAPFFNLYENGQVCMGTVRMAIPADCSLEKFISLWQGYFFGSYFAHLLIDRSPVEGNIVELWKGLVGTGKPFPLTQLRPISTTLQQLIA